MENHHLQWVNPLFLWSFSIAIYFDITRPGSFQNLEKEWFNGLCLRASPQKIWKHIWYVYVPQDLLDPEMVKANRGCQRTVKMEGFHGENHRKTIGKP